jgi:hypothetical protein
VRVVDEDAHAERHRDPCGTRYDLAMPGPSVDPLSSRPITAGGTFPA